MSDKFTSNLAAFDTFVAEKGWSIWEQKDIEHGRQVIVTDGFTRLPVNFYSSGRILPQGKTSDLKKVITEWANLQRAGLRSVSSSSAEASQPHNRIAKYLVIPNRVEAIRDVVFQLSGAVSAKEPSGPAESYRVEVHKDRQRVTVTQYTSGTLMVQGLSSSLFEEVCDVLDGHLTQSFSARATRFIAGETERTAATPYLESPEAENEAARWLLSQIDRKVLEFLYPNDQLHLLAAAGVRNAFQKPNQTLPDYSGIVGQFGKPYEGFLIKLAAHLGLTSEEAVSRKAKDIEVGSWLEAIRARLPDVKRYTEISDALNDAWGSRNKAVHSDFAHPLSILKSFVEADREISTILRAMDRAYRVFVEAGIKLASDQNLQVSKTRTALETVNEFRFEQVNLERLQKQLETDGYSVQIQAEGRKHFWEILNKPDLTVVAPREHEGLVVVKGKLADQFCARYTSLLESKTLLEHDEVAEAWIGVDESGKGDVFGPLVVAAVLVTPVIEIELARRGVRDSKTLSDNQIDELANFIKEHCQFEILNLLPLDYNMAYERHGRNLNRLLAWGHAHLIAKLSRREPARRAISDQFGDESLVIEALAVEGCTIPLVQRPRAESDMAVASASVLARAEFVAAIADFSSKLGIEIPLGSSASEIRRIGKMIYKRWGARGLERIAKMHFKTVTEIMSEG